MNEESTTYGHLDPSKLLILGGAIYFSDRLLRGLRSFSIAGSWGSAALHPRLYAVTRSAGCPLWSAALKRSRLLVQSSISHSISKRVCCEALLFETRSTTVSCKR